MNYNYYDDKQLFAAVKDFIACAIKQQICLGLSREHCFCMGKENARYLRLLNEEHQFFKSVTELPHPRRVVQYRRRQMPEFVAAYQAALLSS